MWTQISLIRYPIRRVSSKPDGRPLPSRAHASGRLPGSPAVPPPHLQAGARVWRPPQPALPTPRLSPRSPRALLARAPRVAGVPEGAAREASLPLAWGAFAFARATCIGSSRARGNFSPHRNHPGNLVTPRYVGYSELNVRNEVSKAA